MLMLPVSLNGDESPFKRRKQVIAFREFARVGYLAMPD